MTYAGENNAFLGDVYLSELKRVAQGHNLGAKLLSRDWTEQETTSPSRPHLMYHRHNDVRRFLNRSTETFLEIGDKYKQVILPYAEHQHPDSWLNRALSVVAAKGMRFSDEMLYPEVGLNFILFTDLILARSRTTDIMSNPKESIPRLEKGTHNPALIPILRAAADSQIFKGAQNGKKGFDEAMGRTKYASTATVRRAMRAGLDHKVFVAALDMRSGKDKFGVSPALGPTPSADSVVDHYASSETSARMIHDHFASRNVIPENRPESCCTDRTFELLTIQLEAARTFAIQDALWDELSRVKDEGNKPAEEPIRQLIELNTVRLDQIAPERDIGVGL